MKKVDFEKAFPKLTKQLSKHGVDDLCAMLHEMQVPGEHTLIEQDSDVDTLYLVAEGEFRSEIDQPDGTIQIEQFGPGRWIGAKEFFGYESKSPSRVVSAAASQVVQLQHADFSSALKEHPVLASTLTREIVEQMSDSARYVDDMVLRKLEENIKK